ncbi:MAG: glycosyltransferase family 2 protein [Candidatus Woesearchaeota archaeon]
MPKISFVLPCRNEELALPFVLGQINEVIKKNDLDAEIIVSDSSSDKSPEIAKKFGVKLVKHDQIGYGRAYLEGFKAVTGDYVIIGDADGTYDFNYALAMIKHLDKGYDFVIGNRLKGKISKDSMPWLHRYVGNPLLSWILRLFFRGKVGDAHCGLRAIKKSAYDQMNLQTTGMEFASEMLIKAIKLNFNIKEIPISYNIRKGESKLSSFQDGWRHLRFMLMYSPLFLFFFPGIFLFLFGIISMIWFYLDSPLLFGVQLYFHPMFLSSTLIIIGYQLILFSAFAKTYAIIHFNEESIFMNHFFEFMTLERACTFGLIFIGFGIGLPLLIIYDWINSGFKSILEVKNLIVSLTFLVIGIQTIFSAFMLSIIAIKHK